MSECRRVGGFTSTPLRAHAAARLRTPRATRLMLMLMMMMMMLMLLLLLLLLLMMMMMMRGFVEGEEI